MLKPWRGHQICAQQTKRNQKEELKELLNLDQREIVQEVRKDKREYIKA